jgi:ADP-dependent NAD(P)H-hydrate dehydratase / NAD(P)H-hydrate epimerase
MTELLTAAQMRAIEQAAIASGEVTGLELMERAGRGVVEAIFEEWPELEGDLAPGGRPLRAGQQRRRRLRGGAAPEGVGLGGGGLPLRRPGADAAGHKFSHGHALILAGGPGKGGRGPPAARGALRIGAGLVTLACPPAR